ncbi:MAG: carbamoyltransferase C-terminal domain-containing protein, partial [Candidatus Omnitrophota bacterium]|nr:carbamoyltransferase C-terminal domain-containing protein [Candidatus Omnitrophota bacterium]
QGRMEFGPRALGARSIIGDGRSSNMQSRMNLKIKFRESFRPFAPSVLAEKAKDYFDIKSESPYMLLVANVNSTHLSDSVSRLRRLTESERYNLMERLKVVRSDIPAVTHVDNSARLQTVSKDTPNKAYYDLINEFYRQTGCPVVINTSFNIRGEPIVCLPEDAYRCFMATDMDYLVMGSFVLDKTKQPERKHEEKQCFELD